MSIRSLFASLVAATALVLAGCPTTEGTPPNSPDTTEPTPRGKLLVGATVAARWSDGKWYLGRIAAITDDRYAIDYLEGDHGTVGPGEILPISSPMQIVPGAHVLALWKGASMYPGVVLSVHQGHARVRWDDGDLPLEVPFNRIAVIGSVAGSAE